MGRTAVAVRVGSAENHSAAGGLKIAMTIQADRPVALTINGVPVDISALS